MSQSQKTADGRETGYGYGWYVGGTPGFATDAEAVFARRCANPA